MVAWIPPDHHLNTGHLNTRQVKVSYSDVFVIHIPLWHQFIWNWRLVPNVLCFNRFRDKFWSLSNLLLYAPFSNVLNNFLFVGGGEDNEFDDDKSNLDEVESEEVTIVVGIQIPKMFGIQIVDSVQILNCTHLSSRPFALK